MKLNILNVVLPKMKGFVSMEKELLSRAVGEPQSIHFEPVLMFEPFSSTLR